MIIDGGLRKLFRENLRDAHSTSIETGMVSPGTPDWEVCFKGGYQCWVEFKKTHTNAVSNFKPLQIGWLEQRCRYGGRAFVAVRKTVEPGRRRVECDDLYLFTGMAARHLQEGGISSVPTELRLGVWESGPRRWNWDQVRGALTGWKSLGQ